MTKVSKEMVNIRIKLLKDMHQYIIEIGDEEIYMDWVTLAVPDEPREDDFESIAEDDENWCECCSLFYRLAKYDLEENY